MSCKAQGRLQLSGILGAKILKSAAPPVHAPEAERQKAYVLTLQATVGLSR